MEQVFAPWRIEWVERDDRSEFECVFCELPGSAPDRETLVVARSERSYVLLNSHPYNPGHVMVIPDAHVAAYEDLDDATLIDHARLKQRTLRALDSAFGPDGFNVGYNLGSDSGGSIRDHLHAHVVPRWRGDTNFMPVIDDTKVIVQALDESWEQLRAAFGEQESVTLPDDPEAAARVDPR